MKMPTKDNLVEIEVKPWKGGTWSMFSNQVVSVWLVSIMGILITGDENNNYNLLTEPPVQLTAENLNSSKCLPVSKFYE